MWLDVESRGGFEIVLESSKDLAARGILMPILRTARSASNMISKREMERKMQTTCCHIVKIPSLNCSRPTERARRQRAVYVDCSRAIRKS
jgi:hypothetical protein